MKQKVIKKTTSKTKDSKSNFSLAEIGISSFKVVDFNSIFQEDLKKHEKLSFNFSAGFTLIEKLRLLQLEMEIDILINREKIMPFSQLVLLFDFKIENIDQFRQGDKIIVPAHEAKALALVGNETARGIIWCKFADTVLNRVVLPITHENLIPQSDLVFKSVTSKPKRMKK